MPWQQSSDATCKLAKNHWCHNIFQLDQSSLACVLPHSWASRRVILLQLEHVHQATKKARCFEENPNLSCFWFTLQALQKNHITFVGFSCKKFCCSRAEDMTSITSKGLGEKCCKFLCRSMPIDQSRSQQKVAWLVQGGQLLCQYLLHARQFKAGGVLPGCRKFFEHFVLPLCSKTSNAFSMLCKFISKMPLPMKLGRHALVPLSIDHTSKTLGNCSLEVLFGCERGFLSFSQQQDHIHARQECFTKRLELSIFEKNCLQPEAKYRYQCQSLTGLTREFALLPVWSHPFWRIFYNAVSLRRLNYL